MMYSITFSRNIRDINVTTISCKHHKLDCSLYYTFTDHVSFRLPLALQFYRSHLFFAGVCLIDACTVSLPIMVFSAGVCSTSVYSKHVYSLQMPVRLPLAATSFGCLCRTSEVRAAGNPCWSLGSTYPRESNICGTIFFICTESKGNIPNPLNNEILPINSNISFFQ